MNALTIIDMKEEILSTEKEFEIISQETLNFRKEYQYSMQALEKHKFLLETAIKNPQSLRSAIVNIAGIGLSLNGAEKLAFLVPRDGAVHLDVSYIGLLKLAVMDNGVLWGQARSVREKDHFELRGFGEEPIHSYLPFSGDRGAIVGVYCVVKTFDNSFLTTTMTIAECLAIRDRTQIWQKSKSGPWKSDEEAMCLKTVIKRGSKLWPKGRTSRLDKAIQVINEHEGIDFDTPVNKKVSEATKLLTEKLKPKLIHVDKECQEIIENIISLSKQICTGLSEEDKKTFIVNKMKISSFGELYKEERQFLLDLEAYLLEESELYTTKKIDWEAP